MPILDLGIHVGEDTRCYLAKRAKVIGVEPNPELVTSARKRFRNEIESGQLIVLEAAFSSDCASSTLYLNENDEWSSLIYPQNAGGMKSIEVKTADLLHLYRKFGQFDFIKCDIEGMDGEFLKQLINSEKLRYVSKEFISSEWLEYLSQCGYQNFKVINNA